jgi:PAS domain S-box-containing protein
MLRVYGAEADEDTSAPEFWFNRIHPEDRQRVLDTFTRCEIEKTDYRTDYRIVLPDGTVKYQHSVGHPVLNESGELVEFVGTAMDTTEQWHARVELEETNLALVERERDLRLLVDSIPGMVYTMNAVGDVQLVNEQLLTFLATTAEALKEWISFIHPDDHPRVLALWQSTIRSGQPYDVEHRLRRGDGVYRWFNSRGVPVRDADGRVVRWYSLLTDVDDRKSAEEALRQTQSHLARAAQIATVAELSASIAHEVNQPLAAVVANGHACLRWLFAEPPNLAKAAEAVDRIVRDGKDAGEVVRRVRALFKRAAVEKIALNVNDVINEVLRLLEAETTRKRVTVEVDLDIDLPPVVGDRIQRQQLVLNLLLNGLEAMDSVRDRPKNLIVRSKRSGRDVALIEIRDYGLGLTDPVKAFEAFFTTKQGGMGMGLAICRSIVDAHDGQLWASSDDAPGTTFSFTLPLGPTAQPEGL